MNVQVNGVILYYEKQGSGPPLVLLHGNGEDGRIFDRTAEVLAPHYTVYTIDSRCHGKSSRNVPLSYDLMAADVLAFSKALQLEKPVICGFSDGGIVALLAAIRAPELPGALIACGANTTPAGLKWCKTTEAMGSKPFRMVLRYLVCREPRTKMMLCQPQISPAMLGRIQVPTLVLCGAHDMIRPADSRAIAAAIPGARLQELPHEGHGTYIVHSPKLAHLVLAFLRSL